MIRSLALRRRFTLPLVFLAVAAVSSCAAYWRLTGFDWDEGAHLHPDERFLAMVTSAIQPVDSFDAYLDTKSSTLNPNNRGFGFYVYGDLPIIAVKLLGEWLAKPGNDIDRTFFGIDLDGGFASARYLGRGMSATADLLVTFLVYAIGAGLYGRAVGVLACALYAAAVLPIQQSHFYTVDTLANLFVALSLWLAVRAIEKARWIDDLFFGLALGAGLATKLSIGPALLLLVLAVVVRYGLREFAAASRQTNAHRARAAILVRGALSINVVLLVAALSFRVLQPYAFLPQSAGSVVFDALAPSINPDWTAQMSKAAAQQSGDDDSPPNHQWATRPPLVFAWLNMVRFGLGWPLGLAAWIGWAWALVEGVQGRAQSWRHVLLVSWVGIFTGWYGAGWVASMRYLLPVYPALAILAAWLLLRLAAPELDATRPGSPAPPPWRRALGVTATAFVLCASGAWATAFSGIYERPHPRLAASRWIYQHLPVDLTATLRTQHGETLVSVGLANDWTPPGEASKTQPREAATRVAAAPVAGKLTPAVGGRLTALRLNGVRAVLGEPIAEEVLVEIGDGKGARLASCSARGPFAPFESAGAAVTCEGLAAPELRAGSEYTIALNAVGGSILLAGASIAHEGSWDDGVPLSLPGTQPWQADFQIHQLEIAWEDNEEKRQRLQHILDRVDYLTISSNRFYDSLRRNPRRWPMTLDYYRALFSGRLGFDVIAEFSSYPRLGPWCIDDQGAEEAFTVYDHPRVFVFAKTARYDPATTAAVLEAADLGLVERRTATMVIDPPAALPIPSPPECAL